MYTHFTFTLMAHCTSGAIRGSVSYSRTLRQGIELATFWLLTDFSTSCTTVSPPYTSAHERRSHDCTTSSLLFSSLLPPSCSRPHSTPLIHTLLSRTVSTHLHKWPTPPHRCAHLSAQNIRHLPHILNTSMHYLEVFRILPGTFQTSPRTSILLSVPPRPLSSQLIRQLHRCVNLYLLNIGAACIPTSIELTWVNSVSPSPLSTLSLSVPLPRSVSWSISGQCQLWFAHVAAVGPAVSIGSCHLELLDQVTSKRSERIRLLKGTCSSSPHQKQV